MNLAARSLVCALPCVLAIACSSGDSAPTPGELCDLFAEARCRGEAMCGDDDGLPGDGPGVSSCVAAVRAELGCATATAESLCADRVYDDDAAAACAADLSATAICRDGDGDRDGFDSANCDRVCREPRPEDPGALGEACTLATADDCAPGRCAAVLLNTQTRYETLQCVTRGSLPLGAECSPPNNVGDSDDCDAGLKCVERSCQAMCTSDAGCPAAAFCLDEHEGSAVGTCYSTCDPLAQDCLPAQGCYPLGGGDGVCLTAGFGYESASCEGSAECEAGLACLGGECRVLCDYGRYPDQWAPGCDADYHDTCRATTEPGLGYCDY